MKTALTCAKSRPALILPAQAPAGSNEVEPNRSARPALFASPGNVRRRRTAKNKKRTKPTASAIGGTLGRLPLILISVWQFLATALRPLRLRCGSRRLRVVETLSLANKQTLALVKVDGQDFLIGTNATSLAVLAMMDPNQGGQVSLADAQQLAASFYSKVQ